MTLDPLRIGCGDIDYAIEAFDAGLIGKGQLATDALIYARRCRDPKYDAQFREVGR
jgi:hypothetical protein